MGKADQVRLIRGEIPPIQSVFFAKMGEMLKHNAQYAHIFAERFKPNPKQQQLFDICDHSEVPPESDGTNLPIHVQCYGPTGSSKSYGVIAYVLRQLLNYPGVQALWVRQKLGDIKKSAWKDVKKFLDTYGIPFEKNESDLTIKLPNGSSIVMSSDLALTPSGSDKADSLGSTAYSFVVFEEADSIRETTAITMAGRMRESVGNFRKVLFYICNPPDEFHWLYKWFFGSDNDPSDPMSRYRALKFDVRDNVKHVGEAYLKGIEQDFARNRFLQKRLGEGEYGIVPKGVPYFMDSFYEYHIQDLRIDGPDGRKIFKWNRLYPLQRGCDPGARGTSMVVMQEDPELKQLRVFFCRLVQDTYLESYLAEVLPELNRLFPGAIWEDFVDTAAKQRTANSDKSCLEIMRAFGMRPRHKPMSVNKGLEILSRMFRTQQMGRQRVVFDPWGAKTLIQAFQGGYCKDPKTGLPIKDGVYDHCVDSIRYPVTHIFDIGDSGELELRTPGEYQSFEEKWTPVAGYGTNIFASPAATMQRGGSSGVSYNNPYSRRRR